MQHYGHLDASNLHWFPAKGRWIVLCSRCYAANAENLEAGAHSFAIWDGGGQFSEENVDAQ